MRHIKTWLLVSVLINCVTCPQIVIAQQSTVEVKGTTSYYRDIDDKGNPLPPDQQGYRPLPNVRVRALRRSVIASDVSKPRNGDAHYELSAASGAPFHVLFHDNNTVPELQTLTADPAKSHLVHVTLLTSRQYEDTFGREALVNHLKKILRLLRQTEGVEREEIQRLQELFHRKFDIRIPLE